MANDPFGRRTGAAGPAATFDPVVPSDTADLPRIASAVRATGAGTVHCVTAAGDERTFSLAAGADFPCGIRKVFATGTTATGLLAFITD